MYTSRVRGATKIASVAVQHDVTVDITQNSAFLA